MSVCDRLLNNGKLGKIILFDFLIILFLRVALVFCIFFSFFFFLGTSIRNFDRVIVECFGG